MAAGMKKHGRKIAIWVFLGVYMTVVLGFVSKYEDDVICSNIMVHVVDSSLNQFVDPHDVIEVLDREKVKVLGYAVNDINTYSLEKLVLKHPPVADAEIYSTVSGTLHVAIKQREPIIRIISPKDNRCYIDKNGRIMPISKDYASHVVVANGHIKTAFPVENGVSVVENGQAKDHDKSDILTDLFELAHFIDQDDFWKAQIEQIYVNEKYHFELIPRVGANVIYFGENKDTQYKFKKLKTFYHQGLNNIGWNKYDLIDLRYSNQVICKKPQL